METILVTGGTGTLGRSVVPLLRAAGRRVRLVGRRPHDPGADVAYVVADLARPASVRPLEEALAGVDVVLHLAGSAKGDDVKTRHLLEAVTAAGAHPHIVFVSVLGAERIPVVSAVDRALFGYVKAKRDAELMITESGVPWSIVRASQFHSFGAQLALAVSKAPIALVPAETYAQLIDVREVAERLVEIALSGPTGQIEELAGPSVYGLDEVVRSYLRSVGRRRLVVGVRMPGRAAAAFRDGANLDPDLAVGRRTWEQYLAETNVDAARVAR